MNYEITRNGQLNYKVKDFTDRSMIGKTGTIHVRVTMKNYKDVSYDLTVTLTDQKKVVLKAGSEIKVYRIGNLLTEKHYQSAAESGRERKSSLC